MPVVKLTELGVERLRPRDKQIEYFDSGFNPGVSGTLGLRVSPQGKKSFFISYRLKDDAKQVKQKHNIGSFPEMSLAVARKTATALLGKIDQGDDPKQKAVQRRQAPTFNDLADAYLKFHAERHKRPVSVKEDVRILNKDILPAWGNVKAKDIKRRDVLALLDEVAIRGPVMANRVLALASTIFNVGIQRELVETNPCYRVSKPGGKEKSRERVLSHEELKSIWLAMDSLKPTMAALLKVRALTGQRGGEACSMRWEDVDLKEQVWTIPAEVTKNKTVHRVPLTQSVIDLICGTGSQGGAWVFPSTHGSSKGHIYNMQKASQQLKRETGIDDFRLHDLRRTCASLLAEDGVSEFLIGKVLNHTNESITAVYNKHSYDTEKRQALEKWEKRLSKIVGIEIEEAGKVIPLRKIAV